MKKKLIALLLAVLCLTLCACTPTYTVRFSGFKGSDAYPELKVKKGEVLPELDPSLPIPTEEGKIFTGFNLPGNPTGSNIYDAQLNLNQRITLSKDWTLYPVFVPVDVELDASNFEKYFDVELSLLSTYSNLNPLPDVALEYKISPKEEYLDALTQGEASDTITVTIKPDFSNDAMPGSTFTMLREKTFTVELNKAENYQAEGTAYEMGTLVGNLDSFLYSIDIESCTGTVHNPVG